MGQILFDHCAIIGGGLIGTSVALAVRRHGLVRHLSIVEVDKSACQALRRVGVADFVASDLSLCPRSPNLVIVASPLSAYRAIGDALMGCLATGAIVTDVGSVKLPVVRDLGRLSTRGVHLVPAHPLAGHHASGAEHATADLFTKRKCVVCPLPEVPLSAVGQVLDFWSGCGMEVVSLSPELHDRVVAFTSHVPHLIAYSVMASLDAVNGELGLSVRDFAGSGFHDFTRIAGAEPVIWRDILFENRTAVLEMLARVDAAAAALVDDLRSGNRSGLERALGRARSHRQGLGDGLGSSTTTMSDRSATVVPLLTARA